MEDLSSFSEGPNINYEHTKTLFYFVFFFSVDAGCFFHCVSNMACPVIVKVELSFPAE